MRLPLPLIVISLAFAGCATNKQEAKTKPIHERPWVGGKFETVATPHSIHTNNSGFRKRGALLTNLQPDSPLAKAGLQEGDLILRLNGENVRFEKDIRKRVDRSPNNPLAFTIYRAGEISDKTVRPGVERFQKFNAITFGLSFKTNYELDLFPNPDFSLIALGYDVKHDRLDLEQPKAKYEKSLEDAHRNPNDQSAWTGLRSDEGWKAWLGPIWLTQNKMIVSQQSSP
jgi:membrane-associated protease RseP (regulator of RpoE activity)